MPRPNISWPESVDTNSNGEWWFPADDISSEELEPQYVMGASVQRRPAGYFPGVSMLYPGGEWAYPGVGQRYPYVDEGGRGAGYDNYEMYEAMRPQDASMYQIYPLGVYGYSDQPGYDWGWYNPRSWGTGFGQ